MKIKHSKKRVGYEIFLAVLCGCFVLFACLVDFMDIPFLALLKIRVSDAEAMHMNLFTIQATISVTGAAIISLLTGVTSKEFYGLSVSKFITRIYPVFLKHHAVIIFTFAITFADYFAVSLRLFDVSLAIFACSVLALIYLVRDTFVVFMGDNEIKNRIAESIKESDLTGYAQALFLQSKQYAQTGLFIELKDNLALVETVLEQEEQWLKISSDNTHIELIESFLVDIFKIIVKRQQQDENTYYLRYLLNLYNNSNNNKVYLNLWWISPNMFFQSIKFITYDFYRENYLFISFFESLITNEKYDLALVQESADVFNNSLVYYSNQIYKSLFKSEPQSVLMANKDSIIIDLYEDISRLKNYQHGANKLISSEYEWLLIQLNICYMFKGLIDSGESGKVWNKLFSDYQLLNRATETELSLICITIYLFYLAEYESLAKDKPAQETSKELLREYNHIILDYFYSCNLLEIVKKYKSVIFDLMNRWEWYIDGEAKFVISEHSTTDFLVFISLNTCCNDDIEEIIESLSNGSMFSLYNRYFSKETSFEELYLPFQRLFLGNEEFSSQKETLFEILSRKYRQEIIDKGKNETISNQEIEDYKSLLLDFCEEAKEEYKELFRFVDANGGNLSNKQTIKFASINSIKPMNQEYSNRVLKDGIKQQIIRVYLHLIDGGLLKKSVDGKNGSIQQAIVDSVNSSGINPSTVFGSRFVFWLEENRTLLKDYIEEQKIKQISVSGLPQEYFFVDVSLTNVSICDFKVKVRDLTSEEIMDRCEVNDRGELLYNVTNNLILPFTKEDLFNHIRRTMKIVEIYMDVVSDKTGDKGGLHIIVDE